MIIGTTGSGKTTTFINPTVQILSQSAAKPSILHERNAAYGGRNVLVLYAG